MSVSLFVTLTAFLHVHHTDCKLEILDRHHMIDEEFSVNPYCLGLIAIDRILVIIKNVTTNHIMAPAYLYASVFCSASDKLQHKPWLELMMNLELSSWVWNSSYTTEWKHADSSCTIMGRNTMAPSYDFEYFVYPQGCLVKPCG